MNQINKSANKDIPNIVSKLYKLKKLDKSEQDLLIVSLKNGDIKRSYTNEVEKLLNHSQEIYSSDLKISIRTSEKNKEMRILAGIMDNSGRAAVASARGQNGKLRFARGCKQCKVLRRSRYEVKPHRPPLVHYPMRKFFWGAISWVRVLL